jgi:ABC-type multidrug transport system fused ATPase/permease subunit
MKQPITQLEQLTVTKASKSYLSEIATWARFFAILGFIFIGLLLVFAFFAVPIFGTVTKSQSGVPDDLGSIMLVINVLIAIVYFFPLYYLLQFSKKIKKALKTKNDQMLANAFQMLKSHYKFIGVLTIITISLYFLFFISALMGLL